jgi:hypothetical protein
MACPSDWLVDGHARDLTEDVDAAVLGADDEAAGGDRG